MNVATILDMAADTFPDRLAIVSGGCRITYAELRSAAHGIAQRLHGSGARCVALLDVNSPAVPMALFAAAYAGIPYVPINYRLTKEEVNELIARLAPVTLVTGREHRELVAPVDGVRVLDRTELLASGIGADAPPERADDPRAIAVQLFTSGTTGKPKAAILRHDHLFSYIVGTVEFGAAAQEDAIAVAVPPYHIAGIAAVLSSTYACRRLVQMETFEPQLWLDTVRRERVTNAFLVPTMLARIVEHVRERALAAELPDLRALAYGGGRMPPTTIRSAMTMWPHVDFTNAYGLTETSSTITVLGPEEHRTGASSDDPKGARRLGSVGKAVAGVELEIRDEQGHVLEGEQVGLVFVRGAQVSGEYLAVGSQLDANGWFATHDRGYVDREGYLYLDGRADDVIVRGGENISPGEIEDVLLSHPSVADAAVVAVPDEQWGEAVVAAVVRKPGSDVAASELQDLVRRRLRSSRVPQAIFFRDSLPYNELGKVLRRVIRQEVLAAPRTNETAPT